MLPQLCLVANRLLGLEPNLAMNRRRFFKKLARRDAAGQEPTVREAAIGTVSLA